MTKIELQELQKAADDAGDRVANVLERIQRALEEKVATENPDTYGYADPEPARVNGKHTLPHFPRLMAK